ncbi:MAG: hypothetical protein J0H53_05185 [Rhizobiales bacterium]|nr:hypothetical protein [Hyphomicrobiales bacterium]OJU35086.1 MAG: hypothetical protein BGN94_09025 [Rhizobiales bacterium 68-8]
MTDEPAVPLRLRDLSDETILWLDRLDHKQREALIWCGHLESEERKRLDDFLKLDPEKYAAGFKLLELWTRMSWLLGRLGWLGKTSVWIIMTAAGILIALTQIAEHLSRTRP